MRPEQDAYGEIVKAIHYGSDPDAGEIIEREDGYIEYSGSAENYFSPYEEWSEQAKEAVGYAHGSVVDVGCGAGRHALYLQEKGLDVHGIDVSPGAVEVSRDRGLKSVRQAGIDDVSGLPEAPFDTVLLLGNNAGLLGTKPVERLRNLAESTTDEGIVIGQTREATDTDSLEHTQYHQYNRVRNRRPGCIRFRIRYKQFATPYYDYLFLGVDGLKDVVNATPWELRELIGREADESTYCFVLGKE